MLHSSMVQRLHASGSYYSPDTKRTLHRVCVVLSVILLVVAITAVIIHAGWVQNSSPFESLTSVREVRPIPSLLTEVLDDPQKLPVLYHGDTTPITRSTGKTHHEQFTPTMYTLLILVDSQPESHLQRVSIRNTWMTYPSVGINVIVRFMIPVRGLSYESLTALTSESVAHKDMVTFLEVPEYPQSEKLLYEFIWSEQNVRYNYIMKTREDYYVRIEELLHDVRRIKKHRNVYWGYFEAQKGPGHSGKHPEPEWFLCDQFVRYAHSGGYIISRDLVQRVIGQAEYLQLYNNEDVGLAIWLSPYSDVEWRHDTRFDTEIGNSRGCQNSFVVFPTENTLEMVAKHKRLLDVGEICEKEFELTPAYSFNFDVAPAKCCSPL